MFSVEGKVVVITGAARGMGKAYADGFRAAGAKVWDMDIQGDIYLCDVTNIRDVEIAFIDILETYKRVDVLINNAGISMPHAAPYPDEKWNRTLAVNMDGVFYCSREATEIMKRQGSVSIINISSINAFRGFPNNPAYVASKHAVVGLTRSFAVDYAKYGVRVNAIAPAYVRTPMTRFSQAVEKLYKQRLSMMPMGRWGEPEDMVGPAIFLASDASRYITGQVICVDGGWSIQGLPNMEEE